MNTTIFAFSLGLPVVLTVGVMGYLRPILRHVLTEICGTEQRAEFWIRAASVLALFGGMIVVLAFGPRDSGADLIADLRTTVMLTLLGAFVGVAWIARVIWNSLMNCPETRQRILNDAADPTLLEIAPA